MDIFELCPFMQTVLPHENPVDNFFLTHTQTHKSSILTSFLPYQNSSNVQGYSDTLFFTLKRLYHWFPYLECFQQHFALNKPKKDLIPSKRGYLWAILFIIVGGYSVQYIFLVSFLLFCGFSCLLYFLRNEFTLVPQTFSWEFAM